MCTEFVISSEGGVMQLVIAETEKVISNTLSLFLHFKMNV